MVVSGADQTGYINQQLQPVKLSLVDGAGAPISMATVTLVPAEGVGLGSETVKTNGRGEAAFLPYLPLKPGKYEIKVQAPGAEDVTVAMTATEPPAGTIFTIMNAPAVPYTSVGPVGKTAVLEPASSGWSIPMAWGTNGRLLVLRYGLLAIEPSGALRSLTKMCGSNTGDDGPPSAACVHGYSMASHPSKDIVYVVDWDKHAIRELDFMRNLVTRFAGGGTQAGSNVLAVDSSLHISSVDAVLESGAVLVHGSNGRDPAGEWVVDPAGLLKPWPWHPVSSACPGPYGQGMIASHEGSPGWPFLSADRTGRVYMMPSGCPYPGQTIVRIDGPEMFTHIAGRDKGTTAEGAVATSFDFYETSGKTRPTGIAASEKAIFVGSTTTIRKVDLTSGTIVTIGGMENGTTEDHKPAKSSLIKQSGQMLVHPDGHLLFWDTSVAQVHRLRMIWKP